MGIEAWGASSQGITASSFRTFLTRLRRAIAQSLRPNALGYFKPSGRITINYRFFFASGAEHHHRFDRRKSFSLFASSNAHFRDSGSLCPIECIPRVPNSYPPGNATKRKNCLNYKRSDISESILPIRTLQLRQQPIRAR